MLSELARALAAAHTHRDEPRFQAIIREIMLSERDPLEVEKWRAFLRRQEEVAAKPAAATLADGMLVLVEPRSIDEVRLDAPVRANVNAWVRELRWREALAARGVPARGGALFHGATGTGKTMLAGAVAGELGLPCYAARGAAIGEQYINATSKNLGKVLAAARELPMVLVVDEIDGLAGDRSRLNGSSADIDRAMTTNTLLQELDRGLRTSVLVATTNHASRVDSAVRRRLPFQLEFSVPSGDDMKHFMRGIAAKHGLELEFETDATNYADAEHEALAEVRLAIIEELERGN